MYIWILLASFVTALFAFNLSVRPDSAKLYQESQADAVVTKLVRQHDAAEGWFKYVKKNIENGNTNVALYEQDNSEENVTTDDEVSEGVEDTEEEIENSEIEDAEETENHTVSLSGSFRDVIDAGNLGYLSKYINGMKVNGLPDAETRIFCVGHESETNIDEGASIGECLTKNGDLYILTVAPVPVRWQSRNADGESIGVPNTSMRQVLFKYGGAAYRIGYVVTRDFYPDDMKQNLAVYVGSDEFKLGDFQYIIHNFSYNIDHTQENNEDKQKSIVHRNIVTPIPGAMDGFVETKCGSEKETNCLVVMSSI